MRTHTLATLLIPCLLFTACGGSDDQADTTSTADNCSITGKNQFVYKQMQDTYLWYNQVPILNPSQYASPEAVLDATRYTSLDRWSFLTTTQAFNDAFVTGEYIGVGLSHSDDGYIRYVFNNSPATQANITRGDRILAINGVSVNDIIAQNLWDNIFGAREIGLQLDIQIQKANTNNQEQHTLTKAIVIQNTVLHRSIIQRNNHKAAYLVFNSFTNLSYAELESAFQYFNTQSNIDTFILDLRYNGGGLLDVAALLASLIGGPQLAGNAFYTLQHNDKHSDKNFTLPFTSETNALPSSNIIVLTSEDTCSASEAVINGLKPFINVKLVGGTTCGKPVGMHNPEYCDIILANIQFKGINAAGFGDYYTGFTPDCPANDDAHNAFADPDEAMLKAALHLMENQSCAPTLSAQPLTAKTPFTTQRPTQPAWTYDMYKNHQQ